MTRAIALAAICISPSVVSAGARTDRVLANAVNGWPPPRRCSAGVAAGVAARVAVRVAAGVNPSTKVSTRAAAVCATSTSVRRERFSTRSASITHMPVSRETYRVADAAEADIDEEEKKRETYFRIPIVPNTQYQPLTW